MIGLIEPLFLNKHTRLMAPVAVHDRAGHFGKVENVTNRAVYPSFSDKNRIDKWIDLSFQLRAFLRSISSNRLTICTHCNIFVHHEAL